MATFIKQCKKLATLAVIGSLMMTISQPSMAAQEISEDEFGPDYGSMTADAFVGKPLQLVTALAGTATYAISYPFSYFSGNKEEAKRVLVDEPWEAMDRGLGRSVAYDKYYKSQQVPQGGTRIVVDGPSELIIETDDRVIVDGEVRSVTTTGQTQR